MANIGHGGDPTRAMTSCHTVQMLHHGSALSVSSGVFSTTDFRGAACLFTPVRSASGLTGGRIQNPDVPHAKRKDAFIINNTATSCRQAAITFDSYPMLPAARLRFPNLVFPSIFPILRSLGPLPTRVGFPIPLLPQQGNPTSWSQQLVHI
jgi:hypothetical protein